MRRAAIVTIIASMLALSCYCFSSAGAQTTSTSTVAPTITTVVANTPGTLPDGDDIPSCSLFPTRLGVGRWTFTNRRDFPITLQIITTVTEQGLSGPPGFTRIAFDGTLAGGQATPEFILTPETVIHWAGGTYHLNAYDFVNCLVEEGLETTTTGPTQFSVPPSITAPSTTVPPSTTPSISLTLPSVSTSVSITVPSSIRTPDVSITAPETTGVRFDLTVPANTVPSRGPIPNTGFPFGLVALGGVTLILLGLLLVAISRRDKLMDPNRA